MPINKSNWLQDYKSGTTANASKLVRNYTQATGKLDAATSSSAQSNYESAMRDPKVLARRNSELKKLSEADLNNGMVQSGESAYRDGTANSAQKAMAAVGPYLDKIDATLPSLKPRTRDAVTNVTNRVAPLAKALQDLKNSGS